VRRQLLTALLGFALVALPMAPVIHVHRSHGADGLDHFVAHTHSESHHGHVDILDGRARAEIDHDDSVLTTFSPALAVSQQHAFVAPELLPAAVVAAPLIVVRGSSMEYIERLIHGPPGGSSDLRGPPASTRL
jgi:hypothetical protein